MSAATYSTNPPEFGGVKIKPAKSKEPITLTLQWDVGPTPDVIILNGQRYIKSRAKRKAKQ